MKYRMYFFVPYSISPIQQAIQAGHSMGEYALKYGRYNPNHLIWEFLEKWKTWVILNGGTTNKKRDFEMIPAGSLNQIGDELLKNEIEFAFFDEEDLNDALTAICFIADERVWDWENYPNFRNYLDNTPLDLETYPFLRGKRIRNKSDFSDESLVETFAKEFLQWVESVGGIQNAFLKTLIEGKKLA